VEARPGTGEVVMAEPAPVTKQLSPDHNPGAGHNHSPVDELFGKAKRELHAYSRHDKQAVKALRRFLVHVMEICEFAEQNRESRNDVVAALLDKGVQVSTEGSDWLHALVAAHFSTEDRAREKTNISKYASVLCYARRQGITAAGMMKELFCEGT